MLKLKTFIGALVAAINFVVPVAAHAEAGSLHLSGGPAEVSRAAPFNVDGVLNNNQFKMGITGDLKLLFPLGQSHLAVGPSVQAFEFNPSASPGTQAPVLWNFGGTVRLQANHNGTFVPYVDVSGYADKHGSVWNPAMGATAGLDLRLESSSTFFGGPYVGWSHVFQSYSDTAHQSQIMDHHDVNVVTAGLSLSFDFPVKHTTVMAARPPQNVTVVVTMERLPAPTASAPPPPAAPAPLVINETVQFEKDSAALSDFARSTLARVAKELAAKPGYSVVVKGTASAEGDAIHNLALSQSRANGVVDYLASVGVDRNRLNALAAGAVGVPNDPDNRSVGFVVITLVKAQ